MPSRDLEWKLVTLKEQVLAGSVLYLVFDSSEGILQMHPVSDRGISHSVPCEGGNVLVGRTISASAESVKEQKGALSPNEIDRVIRAQGRLVVSRHYRNIHRKSAPFVPGVSPLPYAGKVYDEDDMASLMESALDFWLTPGRFARQFEHRFAERLGVKHSSLCNSGSSANLLAVSALTSPSLGDRALKPGDEVITVACGFPTTINPIIQNNLIPVYVDLELGTYNTTAEHIEAAVSPRTKAVLLAHTLGNPFDLNNTNEICQRHDLWLIEDCCDALGSRFTHREVGTFGDLSTFSFYPPHHITMGEGGAVATDDPALNRIVESFRDWGRHCWCKPGCDNSCGKRFGWQLGTLPQGYDHKFITAHRGYNLNLSDMQAAVGLSQLDKLEGFIEARKRNWASLHEGLKAHEEYFVLPRPQPDSEPSWFGFALTVRGGAPFTKNDIVKHLEQCKIATRVLFAGNLTRHPSHQSVTCRLAGEMTNTDFVMNNGFWIGVYPGLTSEHISYVLDTFSDFIAGRQRS